MSQERLGFIWCPYRPFRHRSCIESTQHLHVLSYTEDLMDFVIVFSYHCYLTQHSSSPPCVPHACRIVSCMHAWSPRRFHSASFKYHGTSEFTKVLGYYHGNSHSQGKRGMLRRIILPLCNLMRSTPCTYKLLLRAAGSYLLNAWEAWGPWLSQLGVKTGDLAFCWDTRVREATACRKLQQPKNIFLVRKRPLYWWVARGPGPVGPP